MPRETIHVVSGGTHEKQKTKNVFQPATFKNPDWVCSMEFSFTACGAEPRHQAAKTQSTTKPRKTKTDSTATGDDAGDIIDTRG